MGVFLPFVRYFTQNMSTIDLRGHKCQDSRARVGFTLLVVIALQLKYLILGHGVATLQGRQRLRTLIPAVMRFVILVPRGLDAI